MAERLQKDFKELGLELAWNLSDRSLWGRWQARPEAATCIGLIGHLDTVFEPFHPFQEVTKVDDITKWKNLQHLAPILSGPGVADAKGGILLIYELLRSLKSTPWAEAFDWRVFIAADEETGSKLSRERMLSFLKECPLQLVFEPGWYDQILLRPRLPVALGGNWNLVLQVESPSGHSATSQVKVSASEALAEILLDLKALKSPQTQMNFYDLDAKSKSNVITAKADMKVSIRSEDLKFEQRLQRRLQGLKEKLLKNAVTLSYEVKTIWAPQKLSNDQTVSQWIEAHKRLGFKTPIPSASLARSAAAFLAVKEDAQILDSMGLYGSGYHSDQEIVFLGSLKPRLRILLEFLKSFQMRTALQRK